MRKRDFDFRIEEQILEINHFIKDYFVKNGTPDTKAVIGISGGKDSTVAAALLVQALGADRVIGVLMPQDNQADINDSYAVCKHLGIQHYVINIGPAYDELENAFAANTKFSVSQQIKTNAPSRLRMNVLYMVAAAVGGRVCNTGNASEAFIGYTTKYGDLAGDFALLKHLTVTEIYKIGDALNLPYELVHKAPADGMSGLTDEDNTGIPYQAIDDYLLYGEYPEQKIYEKMIAAHKRNIHKEVIRLPAPIRKSIGLYTYDDEDWMVF
jgi:NAD+ synthase